MCGRRAGLPTYRIGKRRDGNNVTARVGRPPNHLTYARHCRAKQLGGRPRDPRGHPAFIACTSRRIVPW